jgi:hypothetical protein
MTPDPLSMDEAFPLSAELAALTRHQYEALLKSSFARMSPEESSQYDQRQLRIAEILESLKGYRKK